MNEKVEEDIINDSDNNQADEAMKHGLEDLIITDVEDKQPSTENEIEITAKKNI